MISSIYDPLGIVVLSAKKILQDICKGVLGWGDVLPELVVQKSTRWLQKLHHLESFELTRCLKPSDFGDISTAQLHIFSDASKDGYGTMTYLLYYNMHSQVHCAFIMGKSRIAPVKSVTIPRMELIATTMASIWMWYGRKNCICPFKTQSFGWIVLLFLNISRMIPHDFEYL